MLHKVLNIRVITVLVLGLCVSQVVNAGSPTDQQRCEELTEKYNVHTTAYESQLRENKVEIPKLEQEILQLDKDIEETRALIGTVTSGVAPTKGHYESIIFLNQQAQIIIRHRISMLESLPTMRLSARGMTETMMGLYCAEK